MSEYHSRLPVQPMDDEWEEGFAFQIDSATPSVAQTRAARFPRQEAENMTDQLRSSAVKKPFRSGRLRSAVQANNSTNDPDTDPLRQATGRQVSAPSAVVKVKQTSPVAGQLYNTSPPGTLVGALNATIKAELPKRETIVIPGSRKRSRRGAKEEENELRLRKRVRHGAVLLSIMAIMLVAFFSLLPLGSGNSGNPIFNGVANWVRTQQQTWQIMARKSDQEGQTTTDNGAPPPVPPAALPKSQYVAIARQAATSNGIPPDYFVQQINAESGFNPNAVSPSGAVGIAQMIPSTAAGVGANPYEPVSALNGAARLMAGYYKQYGDYAKALAAYNAGSGTLEYALKAGGANWMSFLPAETRNYIFKIMGI
jgi:hypothetical protein